MIKSILNSRHLFAIVVLLFCTSFLLSLYFSFGSTSKEKDFEKSKSPSSYNACGYHALETFLKENDWKVRNSKTFRNRNEGFIILNEPKYESIENENLLTSYSNSKVLFIPAKYNCIDEKGSEKKIEKTELIAARDFNNTIEESFSSTVLTRIRSFNTSYNQFSINNFRINNPVQLIQSYDIEPYISSPQGILLGKSKTNESFWILSDPDLLNNHGLDNGDNAKLVLEILDLIAGNNKEVTFISKLSKKDNKTNILNGLFVFPGFIMFIFMLFLFAIALWSSLQSFNFDSPKNRAYQFHKQRIIANTAQLLTENNFSTAEIGKRYFEIMLQYAVEQLYIPKGLTRQEKIQWLNKFKVVRELGYNYTDIENSLKTLKNDNLSKSKLITILTKLHQLNQSLIYGFRKNKINL